MTCFTRHSCLKRALAEHCEKARWQIVYSLFFLLFMFVTNCSLCVYIFIGFPETYARPAAVQVLVSFSPVERHDALFSFRAYFYLSNCAVVSGVRWLSCCARRRLRCKRSGRCRPSHCTVAVAQPIGTGSLPSNVGNCASIWLRCYSNRERFKVRSSFFLRSQFALKLR